PYRLVTSRTVTAGGGPSAGTGWVGVMCGTSFVGCAVQGGRTGSGDGRRGAPVRGRRTRDRRLRGRRVRGHRVTSRTTAVTLPATASRTGATAVAACAGWMRRARGG